MFSECVKSLFFLAFKCLFYFIDKMLIIFRIRFNCTYFMHI